MKVNKTLLAGIGIGMIVGSALLQLMITAARPVQPLSQNSAVSIEQMDMNKLKTEAGKYYQVFDKNQPVFTKEQHEQELQKQLEAEKAKTPSAQPAPSAPPQITALYISPGMRSSQVAKIVSVSGLVENQEQFEQAMAAKAATGKIKSGVHKFTGKPTLDEIIQNLTSKPE